MAQQITNIQPTTELEAVNAMLGAIGEAQLPAGTDLATVTQADIELALNILRDTAREVLSAGWKFNTEDGVEVSPTATYAWLDTSGVTTTLNIFKRPVGSLEFSLTPTSKNGDLDLVERRSKKYTETGAPAMVLYDRTRNRDGAAVTQYPRIYIDVTWACDFQDMPEAARWFITIRASRRLAEQAVGSGELERFSQQDEVQAWKALVRAHGRKTRKNIFDTAGAREALGGRPRPFGGYSSRVFPGG